MLDEGRRILRATSELSASARRLADHWEPELRIATDALIAPWQLWPALSAFSQTHPEIDIRLAEEVLSGTWEALMEERADLCIGVSNPPVTAGVQRVGRVDIDIVFCCAPAHTLAALDQPLRADQLRSHRNIVVADSARDFSPRDAGGLLDGQARMTVSTMASKIQALEAGLGIGFCPRAWVETALASDRLVAPQLAEPRPVQPAYILCRRGERSRAVQWMIEYLSAQPLPTIPIT